MFTLGGSDSRVRFCAFLPTPTYNSGPSAHSTYNSGPSAHFVCRLVRPSVRPSGRVRIRTPKIRRPSRRQTPCRLFVFVFASVFVMHGPGKPRGTAACVCFAYAWPVAFTAVVLLGLVYLLHGAGCLLSCVGGSPAGSRSGLVSVVPHFPSGCFYWCRVAVIRTCAAWGEMLAVLCWWIPCWFRSLLWSRLYLFCPLCQLQFRWGVCSAAAPNPTSPIPRLLACFAFARIPRGPHCPHQPQVSCVG